MLDRFLEFSVYTPDILRSLGFYKALGFSELEIGDVWPHKYAVVSDGDACIGLHARENGGPCVTFLQADLARHARSMSDHGFDFSYLRVDEDVFNELGFEDPDGNRIAMVEARTFSPPPDDIADSILGEFLEVSMPARDAMRSGRFWAPLAPQILRIREEPTTHMRFEAGGISLGVSESIALQQAALCFKCHDRESLDAAIEQHGLPQTRFPGYEGALTCLQAPEGTRLYVFPEDFLGELYEVSEDDDTTDARDEEIEVR